MKKLLEKMQEDGMTWEEAEEELWAQAEDYADAERDRQAEESLYNQGESK